VSLGIASPDCAAREKALGLRELRYFLSVALMGNLGRAARALNVSPAAISQQIRKLEEGIGKPLLLRHGRGVTPTPAGACLRDRLHTVMQLLAAPLDEAEPKVLPGVISLGVPAETGGPLIVPLVRSCRLRWPHVTLEVREGFGADLAEWIAHRYVDVAILEDPPLLSELEVIPIMTEDLGLVAPVHSRIAQDPRPLPVRELTSEPLILPSEQHWLRRRLDRATMQRGVNLAPVLQVDSTTLSKLMVRSGFGYTVLPGTSVQAEVAQGDFHVPTVYKAFTSVHPFDCLSSCRIERARRLRRLGVRNYDGFGPQWRMVGNANRRVRTSCRSKGANRSLPLVADGGKAGR
jgi:DNA-binding transcriptional LysR family regulator